MHAGLHVEGEAALKDEVVEFGVIVLLKVVRALTSPSVGRRSRSRSRRWLRGLNSQKEAQDESLIACSQDPINTYRGW